MKFLRIVLCALIALSAVQADASSFRAKRWGGTSIGGGQGGGGTGLVIPGSTPVGSWAATDEPARTGSGGDYGYDQRAPANFDTVQYQDFTGTIYFGVAAFKAPTAAGYAAGGDRRYGISSVQCAANNGDWTTVSTRSTNPDTGVADMYVFHLRASDFASDQQVEVRCKVISEAGYARVLQGTVTSGAVQHSLFLSRNSGGTLPAQTLYIDDGGNDTTGDGTSGTPYATIYKGVTRCKALMSNDVGGCQLYLKAGSYSYDDQGGSGSNAAATRWLTIEPAPGVARADVIINASDPGDGIRTGKVHLKNLTINNAKIGNASGTVTTGAMWLDNSIFVGADKTVLNSEAVSATFPGGTFITDTSISEVMFAARTVILWRNVTINNITADAFHQAKTVLGATVSNMNPGATGSHPDLWQVYFDPTPGQGTSENYVLYRITAKVGMIGQLIFLDDELLHKDIAMVYWDVAQTDAGRNTAHTNNAVTNWLLADSTVNGPNWAWDAQTMTDVTLMDNSYPDDAPAVHAGVTVRP